MCVCVCVCVVFRWAAVERTVVVRAGQRATTVVIPHRQLRCAACVIILASAAVICRSGFTPRQVAVPQLRTFSVVAGSTGAASSRAGPGPGDGRRGRGDGRLHAATESSVRLLNVDGEPGSGSRGAWSLSDYHRLPHWTAAYPAVLTSQSLRHTSLLPASVLDSCTHPDRLRTRHPHPIPTTIFHIVPIPVAFIPIPATVIPIPNRPRRWLFPSQSSKPSSRIK